MDRRQDAIAHFEGLIRDTDQVLPHCSEALRAELLEQRGYYELALEALRPAPSDEPLTREQLMQVRPERPILVRVRCLDEETGEPDPEDEEFEIWDGQCFANADTYDTLEHYGKKFLAYPYEPACVGAQLTGTQEALLRIAREPRKFEKEEERRKAGAEMPKGVSSDRWGSTWND